MSLPVFLLTYTSRRACTALLVAVLCACGGESATPVATPTGVAGPAPAAGAMAQNAPPQFFADQKPIWTACDLASLPGEHHSDLAQLGGRVQCASMRVPIDYDNPTQGELDIAMMRVAAENPHKRLGSILFNPGGPGTDGLQLGVLKGIQAKRASLADPASRLLKQISESYDLIGFTPRAMGGSTPMYVFVPDGYQSSHQSLIFGNTEETLTKAQQHARLHTQALLAHPWSKHIHTEAIARDMDLMREVLGDAKLNYIGYSYGTWLGAWYASLFPQRVGRMLLDSSMNIAAAFDKGKDTAMARRRLLDEVMLPYFARHLNTFGRGSDPADIRRRLLAMSPAAKNLWFTRLNLKDPAGIVASGHQTNNAIIMQSLGQPVPESETLHAQLSKMLDAPAAGPSSKSRVYDAASSVHWCVTCNDTGNAGDERSWIQEGMVDAARYPLTGGHDVSNRCLYWGAPARMRPSLAAMTAPILMLQSYYDAVTPVEGAMETLNALPNAHMMVVENEYKHGLFPYGKASVDAKVAEYFLTGTLPFGRVSYHAGKPLPMPY